MWARPVLWQLKFFFVTVEFTSMSKFTGVLLLAVACTAMHAPGSRQLLSATRRNEENLLAAKKPLDKPPRLLQPLFGAVGLATGAAWTTVVFTTIRSNQPLGAMMPSSTHGVFARTSVLSALPLIASCYSTLATASADSWERLGSPTCRRINLALVAAGLGSLLWVGFAPLITQIPGTAPEMLTTAPADPCFRTMLRMHSPPPPMHALSTWLPPP